MTGFNSKRDAAADKDALFQKFEMAQPAQEPVAHPVIAGALFDFMGWLTSRKKRIVLSSADEASPAIEAITEFAKMRNLSLDDAQVREWKAALAQPAQEPVAYVTGMSFGRFIVEPLNPAMVLPVGMALYSAPQEKT